MSDALKTVAITGGTGFIGRHLCRHLHRLGYRVRVLVRSPEKARSLHQSDVEIVTGALSDTRALARLVDGCDAIIYGAGAVRGRQLADFLPANVNGIASLLSVLDQTGTHPRLLLLSSLAARQPELSHYASSKFMGERVLAERGGHCHWSILRPTAVYGPGDKELLPLLQLMERGVATITGRPDNRVSLIYVDDLIRAITAWLAVDDVPREVYSVADPVAKGYSWREIATIAATVLHRNVRLLPVPQPLLQGIASLNLAASGLFNYAPMLTPGKVRELYHPDWRCDSRAFSAATGWQAEIPFAVGLARTLGLPE